jgi:hypothetical protein
VVVLRGACWCCFVVQEVCVVLLRGACWCCFVALADAASWCRRCVSVGGGVGGVGGR